MISKEKAYDNLYNEGEEGFNPYHYPTPAQEAQMMADEQARFLTEWTLDVTKKRRAEWSSWVNNHRNVRALTGNFIAAKESEWGWRMVDLRRAVKHYEL